jgi:hypothetical protein
VRLDRPPRQLKLRSDLGIRVTEGNQSQDLGLAGAQAVAAASAITSTSSSPSSSRLRLRRTTAWSSATTT